MFKLAANPTFTHDVEITEPVDGGHRKQKLKTTFRVITTDRYQELIKDGDLALLREVVERFHDVEDENGQPVEYSDALRDQLIQLPYIRIGVVRGYNEAIVGARAKN